MSHYGDYISERLGKLIYECDDGFAVYWYFNHQKYGPVVYIEEIYVDPKKRRANVATKMADFIVESAQARGVKYLIGSVNPRTKGATNSLKVLLAYGMDVDWINGELIMFVKQIGD